MPYYPPPSSAVTTLTTKGDLLGHTGSVLGRLAASTNGLVLGLDSTQTLGLRWGFSTPVYSLTGVDADRTINVDSTTFNELLNIVGTLIQDLQTRGIVA
jgi:hypothetical protein